MIRKTLRLQPRKSSTIINKMSPVVNKRNEIRKARAIAEASLMALGSLPAARVMRDHLATVTEWRNAGASWEQIAAILRDAGWRSKTGGAVSAQSLRAMVSRIRRELSASQAADVSVAARASLKTTQQPFYTDRSGTDFAADAKRSDVAERIQRAASLRHGRGG